MEHYGQVDASATLYIPFTTHDTDGAAIAPSSAFEAADVRIYKNGSATQRSSEAGYTMTSPFDSVTGLHLLAVDLSDNTDSGFYAAGSRYFVVLVPDETVDTFAVVRVLADFTIGPVATDVNAIADAILKRDWTAVSGESARSVLNALRFLRNKWSLAGGTLTVTEEDDTTTAWTAAVDTDAAAEPIIGSDPT